jgi:hypothetical protein
MSKRSRQPARRKKASPLVRALTWGGVVGLVGLLVYGATRMSGVAYGEDAIGVVNFSALNADQKRTALQAANRARCTCGCGMTLAECVSTDSTCPVRDGNIERIRTMVREAEQARE